MLVVNRNDHAPLAEELIRRHCREGQSPVFTEGGWWQWNGRHWAELTRQTLVKDLARVSSWACWAQGSREITTSSHFFNSIISIAEALAHEPGFFADATPGVAFADAFVRVTESGLSVEPNSHTHRARWSYGFNWDPNAECPQWMAFLRQVWARPSVPTDQAPDDAEQKIECLGQFVGASLAGVAYVGQRALLLTGAGGNGKSVLCDAVRDIFPPETVVSVPPHDLRTPERVSRLAAARLNVVSDISERGLTDTGLLKQVISGDITDARRLYQASFSFRPVCGHIFSANSGLITQDYSTGFQRRWIVLDFPNCFLSSGVRRTTPELLATFRAERPGMVRWALEGVAKLMAFREYVIPPSSAEAVKRWRMTNDKVACYMEERLEVNENWGATARELYRDFVQWCREVGHQDMAQRTFSERLANLGVQYRRIGSTGRQFKAHIRAPGRGEGELDG